MIFHFFIFMIAMTISDTYRILGVFPFSAKSHNIVYGALMKSLAKRGHHVDVISHFPQKILVKNYYNIINLTDPMETYINNIKIDDLFQRSDDISKLADIYGNRLCHFMGLKSMQKLIKNPPTDPPYDLVITEALFAHCYFGLGYVFNVPVVAVSSGIEFPWITYFTGNNDNPAYVPCILYDGQMNLYGRMKNVLMYYSTIWKFHKTTEKSQTDSMRKYLSADIPNIREVEKSVALTLVNSDPILFGIKPITPALIQIGSLHIEENDETLTTELKLWLDESITGVVYFSLGSVILIESFPPHKLTNMYASFEKIAPIRVLIKIINRFKLPPGVPKNVKILSWIPQQPVLAHPNVKAFITHGGLGGIQEAVYYRVPMIGIPLSSDQFRNVDNLVAKKIMIRINFNELSEKILDSALQAVLHDPIYKEKAAYYSKLSRDQPINSTTRAIFWIEHVIRNGPYPLRSPALQLSMLQLSLLDVYGMFSVAIFLIFFLFILFVKIIARASKRWFPIQILKNSTKYKKHTNKFI